MKINEEGKGDPESLKESIASLKAALASRINVVEQVGKQNELIALNLIAKSQKNEVGVAVACVNAAKLHGIKINVSKVLMSEAQASELMEKWGKAVSDSNPQFGEDFRKESIDWAKEVTDYVGKAWVHHCQTYLGEINKRATLLKSLKKFSDFEVQNQKIVNELEFIMNRSVYAVSPDKSTNAREFIVLLKQTVEGIGVLPAGLNEFLEAVNSPQGSSYNHFCDDANQELRDWLESNNFFQNLVLRLKN